MSSRVKEWDKNKGNAEKNVIFILKQDCLLQGQAQLDQRVVFRFSTLSKKQRKNILNIFLVF